MFGFHITQLPFRWQMECLNIWIVNNCRGIIKVVTGAGKSLVGLMAIDYFYRANLNPIVFIVVPTKVLQIQWEKNLIEKCNVKKEHIQKHCGGNKNSFNLNKNFHVFVVNTARTNLPELVGKYRLNGCKTFIIADECHRYGSKCNAKIFEADFDYTLGLSATPDREHDFGFEERIEPNLGNIIFEYGYCEALTDGIIPPFKLTNIGIELTPSERKKYEAVTEAIQEVLEIIFWKYPFVRNSPKFFAVLEKIQSEKEKKEEERDLDIDRLLELAQNRKLLLNRAKNRIDSFVYLITRLHNNSKIIVFHELIDELTFISEILTLNDIPFKVYHSKMTEQERLDAVNFYSQNRHSVLLSCRALDEGLDIPDTHIGIIVAASKATRQRIQRVGRILRKAPGKDYSWIFTIYAADTTEEQRYLYDLERSLFGIKDIEYLRYNSSFSI